MKRVLIIEDETAIAELEKENKALKNRLNKIDEQHRKDIRAVKDEYQEQIAFLKEQLRAWQHHEGIK